MRYRRIKDHQWEINIAGKMYPAIVSLKPLYDPEMKNINV